MGHTSKSRVGIVVVLITLVALIGWSLYVWTRPIPDQWAVVREQTHIFITSSAESANIRDYIEKHYVPAAKAAEANIPNPDPFPIGLNYYFPFVKDELLKRAIADKRVDVGEFLAKLKPTPGS